MGRFHPCVSGAINKKIRAGPKSRPNFLLFRDHDHFIFWSEQHFLRFLRVGVYAVGFRRVIRFGFNAVAQNSFPAAVRLLPLDGLRASLDYFWLEHYAGCGMRSKVMGIASENEGVYVERDKISFTGALPNISMTTSRVSSDNLVSPVSGKLRGP